jgi:hypothetical protein
MTSSVEQLREMIPLYLNGSLSKKQTEEFLQAMQKHPELGQELSEFSDINDAFNAMPMPDEDKFDALFEKISASNSQAEQKPAVAASVAQQESFFDTLKQWFSNPFLSWGIAMAQFAILAVVIFSLPVEKPDQRYQTLSDTSHTQASSINIVFKPTATLEQINNLLHQHQLEIISGPSTANVFLISARNSADMDTLIGQLRQQELVRFVEKTRME